MFRRPKFLLFSLIFAVLSISAAGLNLMSISTAGASVTHSGFYLAVGASESVGVQPNVDAPSGSPTSDGYANRFVELAHQDGIDLSLAQVGCPGETTVTAISGIDHCYNGLSSQLAAAEDFLSAHHDDFGIVTIDLGFNDVRSCIHTTKVSLPCTATKIQQIKNNVASIISSLQSVAGPNVVFLGLNHENPFIGTQLSNYHLRTAYFLSSSAVISQLNTALASVYGSFKVHLVDIAGALQPNSTAELTRKNVRTYVASARESICDYTWMCAAAPYGPNLHPNDTGYAVMANAIEEVAKNLW